MKELILLILSAVGAYFVYGIFAEQIGMLIKNKRETSVPVMAQIRFLLNFKKKP